MSRVAKLLAKLEVDHVEGLTGRELYLQNKDLAPVEPARRTWAGKNFIAFWIADSFNINTWQIVGASVQAGLAWWQVWLTVWAGYFLAACFIVLIGRIGAVYHLPFPVIARSSFGVWGSMWPVFNRAGMAVVWYGVQSWLGGECVQLMIEAIWPRVRHMHNGIPSSGTTTYEFMCFFLFCLVQAVAIWFPVHQIRHLFTVKSFLVPFAGFGFLIWTCKRAGGIGPIVHQPATISGSTFRWAIVNSIMNCIANFATLVVNDPDFTRFAKKPSSAVLSQLLTIPTSFAITSFIGIVVSSASTVLYGETFWNPLDVLNRFMDSGHSGPRAGVFFIAAVFMLAQVGVNIAANSISAGTDMSALFPRYINIRRGGYICAAVGLAMCPWKLMESSNKFTTYLSAYTTFLSAIAGVMASDYYSVKKGRLLVDDLYSDAPGTAYRFFYGVSWQAYAAYICGILINVVGFAGAVGANVPVGATYVYNINFFAGFIVSYLTYWGFCTLKPIPGCAATWDEKHALTYESRFEVYEADSESVSYEKRPSHVKEEENLDVTF